MRIPRRLCLAAAALTIATACSRSSSPALSDDLTQDLAKAGGSDMQLAGSAASRVDVVSKAERSRANSPAPRSALIARASSVARGTRSSVARPPAEIPAPSAAPSRAEDSAPSASPQTDPAPATTPAAGRPQAPQPSTQQEPRGGWRTPGDVIRRAPFPINP